MQTHILGLVTPLMALFFAATFLALWRLGKMERHVLGFAGAFILFPVGYLITHFAEPGAAYLFHVTQFFCTMASITLMASICDRAGLRLHLPMAFAVYAISALTLGFAVHLSDDVGPRLIIVNMGDGIITIMALVTLLTARKHAMIDRAIVFFMALGAADFFVRPVLILQLEAVIPAALYRESISYSMVGLALGLKAVMTAVLLIGATIVDLTQKVSEHSARDPLTGLPGRAAFEDHMRKLFARAHNEAAPLSLIVADIDHFKQVNDIWGHQAGDQAIARFGGLIEDTIRGCDVAGRIGGEEFCIAVWNCPIDPAERLAERIRHAFARIEHAGLGEDIRLTASFGVATAQKGESYEALFARADAALYRAKSAGRNTVKNAERCNAGDGDETAQGAGEHRRVAFSR